ncbi:hypothetical protein [Kineococcus rhizosphaerae]|uniref:hypothetical protein n=1 Tax=Kineococcus rhizosphaerae TaxID=559628 RepID=UPI0011B25286|nr:hypothetical protein [Kineococcus rhizosphaerae]
MPTALAALVPHDALGNALAGHSRAPGSLSWRHELVDEPTAAGLLGGPVPTLPAFRGLDVVERISVHRGLPMEPVADQLVEGSLRLHLRVTYLPADLAWERALRWSAVQRGGSILDVEERDKNTQWPQRVARSRDTASGGDFTVITVDGVHVGVQVDTSGVVLVTWLLRRGGRELRAALLTRRGPRAAVELVADAGVLA